MIRPRPRSPRRARSAPRSGRLRGPRGCTLGFLAPTLVRTSPAAGWGLSSPLAFPRCAKMSAVLNGPDTFQIFISLHRCSPLKQKFRSQFMEGEQERRGEVTGLRDGRLELSCRKAGLASGATALPHPRLPAAGPWTDPLWPRDFCPFPAHPLHPHPP